MYVFREGCRSVSAAELQYSLAQCLAQLARLGNASTSHPLLVESLLRAGELECALADCSAPQPELAAHITDQLAVRLVRQNPLDVRTICESLDSLRLPLEVTFCVPEGFAYYGLHPLQYARLAETSDFPGHVAVVGIRSIGTTLSAVVKAALANRGLDVERTTVRPKGHPFDRVTHFSNTQHEWISQQQVKGAHFLVVDEGPGLSGSSFLATAEALVAAGVAHERVTLACAHKPNPAVLCARDSATRVARFTWQAVPSAEIPEDAVEFVGAGRWREQWVGGNEGDWPASWSSMERAKFMSRDGRRLYKFEGLGHYGAAVCERAHRLAEAGLSPQVLEEVDGGGYAQYGYLAGTNLHRAPASRGLLESIGRYCAFRASALRAPDLKHCQQNVENLELMLRTNVAEEFGSDREVFSHRLELVRPVVADARMNPWKWALANGEFMKFDSAAHGDDHFFPGPTDIAWDLAGAIVEFSLGEGNEAAIADALLEQYQRHSGDNAGRRLPAYLLAYSAFRMGYTKMAAEAMRGSLEQPRLRREYLQYRDTVGRMLARRVAA